ncbi:RHS repeat-associated core domain-containing protein [Micromonosporaceae bacterium Da 78-11]
MPVDATALFPSTQVPTGDQAGGVLPSSWQQATVHYVDPNGRETNVLSPGRHIAATWYDDFGNTVRELDPANRELALGSDDVDSTETEATLAETLSTVTTYDAGGQLVIDELGPEHDVTLSSGGVDVRARTHTTYRYAEDAPEGHTSDHVMTSQASGVRYWDETGRAVDGDVQKTVTTYNWDLLQPLSSTVDPGGENLTTRYTYDDAGRRSSTTTPAGDGTSAATRTTVFYGAGTGSGYNECDNHPEWSDMVCRTGPAAQAAQDPELPSQITEYNMYGQATVTTESNSSGVLRVDKVTYDPAGRVITTGVAAGPASGVAVATRRIIYDPVSSSPIRTEALDGAGQVTAQISRTYDTLGRVTAYTDATGNTSTYTYDIASRRRTIFDGKYGSTTSYDDPEGRGLASQLLDGQAGTFGATYDADGRTATETWPNGVTVKYGYNEEGTARSIEYFSGTTPILSSWTGVHAQNKRSWVWSDVSDAYYEYDGAGRLHTAYQTSNGQCVKREYTLDADSNRTQQDVYYSDAEGHCQNDTVASTTWNYDEADRIVGTGYSYDDLGRTLTVPGKDTYAGNAGGDATQTFYTNDMTHTISQGGSTTTNTLDVVTNRYVSTTKTGSSTVSRANHFSDDSDNPTWIADASGFTRTIAGLGGVAATYTGSPGHIEWRYTDLHGDIIAASVDNQHTLSATFAYDEFGNRIGAAPPRYGYLGTDQRVTDNDGGFMTMGVRTYNPTTGRFLSVDPKYGGSCNPYDYACADPVNGKDPSGLCIPCAIPAAVVDALVLVIGAVIIAMILYYMIKARSSLVAIPGTKVHVAFPSAWAKSAMRYRWTLYHVYAIFRIYPYRIWKYGITRQVPWVKRPAGQLSSCRKDYKGSDCGYYSVIAVNGWYKARFAEALLMSAYALRHGKCPDGAPKCI